MERKAKKELRQLKLLLIEYRYPTMFLGLVPIMWASGTGADVMKRIAAPMIGGIFTSFLLELLIYPGIYETWKWNFVLKKKLPKDGSSLTE